LARLRISLFGNFEVILDGRPLIRFGTDKTRALLVYLVVEADRMHRRAHLAGLLWPDLPESAAHHNLSQSLLLLRRALGEKTAALPFLLASWQTLCFNPDSDYSLDMATF
jgi:DNA-binding SARP family transcriptional activator